MSQCNHIIESTMAGGKYRWCVKKRGHYGTKKFPSHQYNVTDTLRLKITAVRKAARRRERDGIQATSI